MRTGSLYYQGYEIVYDEYGEGERPIVLVHNLLLNRHLFELFAPRLAEQGNRVICIDLLGHGDSDRPNDPRMYSTSRFARQVIALMNHLELDTAVVGGAFLSANVALELAVHNPERVEGLVIQMPMLDNALAVNAALVVPVLLALRIGRPILEPISRLASLVPRSHYLVDLVLDLARRSPGPSADLLNGVLFGEVAPQQAERREIFQPALVVGHRRDPIDPFSDSGLVASDLPNARMVEVGSPLDWTLRTKHLTAEVTRFLDQVWSEAEALTSVGFPSNGSNGHRRIAVGG